MGDDLILYAKYDVARYDIYCNDAIRIQKTDSSSFSEVYLKTTFPHIFDFIPLICTQTEFG